LRARHRIQPHNDRWEVPLPVVVGADRMEGEVKLHLTGADLVHAHTSGLRESVTSGDRRPAPWRTFRYGQGEVGLTLSGHAPAFERSNVAAIEKAQLITYVSETNVLRHHFTFRAANWGERTLTVRLPPGSRPWGIQIDGHWLPRLIPAVEDSRKDALPRDSSRTAEPGNETESVELALPVPAHGDDVLGANLHQFEVIYTRSVPPWTFWQSLDTSSPQLPVAPLAFRRIWRIHSKLAPLLQGNYQRLPGPSEDLNLAALPRHAEALFRLPNSLARLDPVREDQQAGARDALDRAVRTLRVQYAEKTMSLREMVSELAFGYLKDRYSLILDELALREADIRAERLLTIKRQSSDTAIEPWNECGLIAVPTRTAILLTTTSGHGAFLRGPLSEELENALTAAAIHGQDASGRFHSALNWLQTDSIADAVAEKPLEFGHEGYNWSEWEPVAGRADATLTVVRRDVVTSLGLALGLIVGLLFWLLHRRGGDHPGTILLLTLAVFGLGVLWLPAGLRDLSWCPFLVAVGAAVLGYLRTIVRKTTIGHSTHSQPKSVVSAAAVAGLMILGVLGWHGRAAAPEAVAVYIVPGPTDAPDRPTVLAPAELLDRLRALARPTPLIAEGAKTVLLDAAYEGQLVDGGKQAEFSAVFSAHNLSDGSSTLILPLAGIQLTGEVLLDGARVAPLALAAPQTGYSLSVRGRGRHKIEFSFRVPVVGTVEDRNVLFTAPPLLRSRLSWRVPPGVVEPQVVVKNGAQWTTRDNSGLRLEADLGAMPIPLHLHWTQPSDSTRVSYQAAYLWHLGIEANRLTAWLRYRVEQGAIKTLAVDLPAELEVSSASAQRTIPASQSPWLTRFQLRDWYISKAGDTRTLHLELPYPISGDFQVTLELLPRAPLSSPATLPVPSPRGASAAGTHYLAYRTQPGLTALRDTSQNLTRISNKEFAPDWVGEPRLETNFQGVAYRIAADQQPQLLLRLEHAKPVVHGDIEVIVQAGMQRAEIEVNAEVDAPNKDLAFIEWDVPGRCNIASVAGEDVRAWKQNGSRLLVWLNRTTTNTRIHLSGWLPLDHRDGHPYLDLNGPRLHRAAKQHAKVQLAGSGEVALAGIRTRNLRLVKSVSAADTQRQSVRVSDQSTDAGRASSFETSDSNYRLECQVQSAANAVAQALTFAEISDRELHFTTTIDYTVTHGELRHVRFRLRNWEEEKVEVRAEHVALFPGPRRAPGERSWLLHLQPGIHGHYQVTLRGSMPLDKAVVGVAMPEILIQDVERAEYYVAAAGGELTGQAKGPLQSLNSPGQTLQMHWPSAAQRLESSSGQAWRIAGPEWQLRLLPHARLLEPNPVRVYLLEQSAAVVDGRRWLHEARCWLRHEAHADLNLGLPAPARVLAASIDGVEVTTLRAGADRVWLPLPGRPGVCCVRLRWLYDPLEPLDRPLLTSPQLGDAVMGPTLWTVMVPPGWSVGSTTVSSAGKTPTFLGAGAAREAVLALWRADAHLRIYQDLIKQPKESGVSSALDFAQERFALQTSHASHALAMGADRGGLAGPQGENLAAWLEDLRAKNNALNGKRRNSKTETASFDSPFGFQLSDVERERGTPMSWQAFSGAGPLTLQLTSHESQRTHQALATSGQWLGCLTIAWMLAFFPFLLARLRYFWPEQIALLGVFGWHLAGFTSIVGGLLLIAACSRFILLIRALQVLVAKRRVQPAAMTPSGQNGEVPET